MSGNKRTVKGYIANKIKSYKASVWKKSTSEILQVITNVVDKKIWTFWEEVPINKTRMVTK